ncbi:MAG: 5-formyltetrahydrofolate cyclo-ligase [Lachnospiraceae bacterium]|nr:5-formyltetrahydrofolate cyclo-ligase [Lachnospiraceae bacterium]
MTEVKKQQLLDKKVLRRQILAARDALSEEERKRAALFLTERICGHQWFYMADTVLTFVSYGSEIDTTDILREALAKGKKVYAPKVTGQDMVFYRICSEKDLVLGYKGIREPVGDTEPFLYDPTATDRVLMLMPGAVFDLQKNRIGYGKGFYDRYLADKEELRLKTIAVGFQCQMVEELPANDWDIKPYQVICV